MYLSRRLDEKMLILLKQGKSFFHIGASGHEAAQLAAATSVSDLDAIQDALSNDKDLLKGIPPEQVVEFNKIT